jgi:hypothetical protein
MVEDVAARCFDFFGIPISKEVLNSLKKKSCSP